MFVVMNRVPVAPGWEHAFEERFRERAGQVERNPGFVRMEVLKPETPDTPYLVSTVWESQEAFRAWVGSEDFKAAHSNPLPREAYRGEGKMEKFDVVITARATTA
jgi:heme-degrading monooxygenase HmoA